MSRFIYADHAGTTALSQTALAAMTPYFTEQYGNPSSLYRFGQEAKADLERARADIAACIGAKPEEIMALKGKTTGHIITSAIEHHALLHTAQHLEKQGYTVTYLPVDELGRVSPADVEAAVRPDTVLISIMAANNEIGTIQPVAEIGAVARRHKILFHTDAVQAVGHIPVDVEAWNVDLLSLSAHKFQGPKGVGVLYVRRPLRLPPLLHGGGQELEAEGARLSALRDRLISGLTRLPYTRLTGDPENRLPGTASFVFEGVEGEALLLHLDARGICASSGSACSSASLDPSHVLLAIGLPHAIAHGSLRLSLGADNTDADVDAMLAAVPEVVAYLRNMSPVWDAAEQKPTWVVE